MGERGSVAFRRCGTVERHHRLDETGRDLLARAAQLAAFEQVNGARTISARDHLDLRLVEAHAWLDRLDGVIQFAELPRMLLLHALLHRIVLDLLFLRLALAFFFPCLA